MKVSKDRLRVLAGLITEASEGKHGFRSYLDSRDNKLPADEYAGHLNYLKQAMPLVKELELLQRTRMEDPRRFTDEEKETLRAAIAILKSSLIPIAIIEKEDEEEIVLLDI